MLPNIVLIGPSDEAELKAALEFALKIEKPVAIRYPKDLVPTALQSPVCSQPYELGRSVPVRKESGSEVVLAAYGPVLKEALKAAEELAEQGISVDVINARFAKPIDEGIINLIAQGKTIITLEDHCMACGFGSAVLEAVSKTAPAATGRVLVLGGPDNFVGVDSRSNQLTQSGLTADEITNTVKKLTDRPGNTANPTDIKQRISEIRNAGQSKKIAKIDNLRGR